MHDFVKDDMFYIQDLEQENKKLKQALEIYADPESWSFYDWWLWGGPVPDEEGSLYRDPGEPARIALGLEEKNKEWIAALKKSREPYDILNRFFSIKEEAKALDFIYEYLNRTLTAGDYYSVNEQLRWMMEVPHLWNKGIEQPIYSLAFAQWTGHEPEKFPMRKYFMEKLTIDYIVKLGQERATRLLQGLL